MCEICELRNNYAYPAFRVAQAKNGGWLQAACRDVALEYAVKLGGDPSLVALEPYRPEESNTKYAKSYEAIRQAQEKYEANRA